jgi:hypothetical protein
LVVEDFPHVALAALAYRVILQPMSGDANKVRAGFPTGRGCPHPLAQSFLADKLDAAIELLQVPIVRWSARRHSR